MAAAAQVCKTLRVTVQALIAKVRSDVSGGAEGSAALYPLGTRTQPAMCWLLAICQARALDAPAGSRLYSTRAVMIVHVELLTRGQADRGA
ncbi:hypothetical protein WJX84_003782 [Apatococcus fuscideae]|uniref:Uncharacterized protein n=1 Tax=Apatococcus fuscideae TaxID=2026836 RepID=A0AAW1SPJ2_9CHLO